MQTPEMVLDRRVHNKAHRTSYQLLIKWKNSPAELATWEEDEIIRLFPEFMAWGQAVANGGGNVIVRKVPASPEGKRSKRARKPNPKFHGQAGRSRSRLSPAASGDVLLETAVSKLV